MHISLYNKPPFVKIDELVVSSNNNTYEIGDNIGYGGNSAVYECFDINGNILAIKFLLRFTEKARIRFSGELTIMKSIEHPHIIKLIDSGNTTGIMKKNKKDKKINVHYIVMERADMNLYDYIKQNDNIAYGNYAAQLRGLSEALSVIHAQAFHRDIKPENILVKGEKWVISDFGLCKQLDDPKDVTSLYEKIGPKYWMSPEAMNNIVFHNNDISTYSDVYQLCAIFWLIINRKYPLGILQKSDWNGEVDSIYDVLYMALQNDYRKRPKNGTELYELMCIATIEN